MEDRLDKLLATFDAIEARLKTLEAGINDSVVGNARSQATVPAGSSSAPRSSESTTVPTGAIVKTGENATVDRLQAELEEKGVSATFIRAPKEYYNEALEFRQAVLGAPSIDCLCKSIVMENTRIDEDACREDPSLIKYWLVVVQYACPGAKKELLNKCVHSLQPSLSKKKVNMRVVAEDVSMELSGFGKNAVSPVGLRTKMPIILAKAVADLDGVFWLGGGETDLKLGMRTTDFIAAYEPIIAPLY